MLEGITSAVHRFFERRRQEKMRSELLALDDHALADIGMSRTDLELKDDPSFIHDPNNLDHEIDRTRRTH
jgi:hypothetical protein